MHPHHIEEISFTYFGYDLYAKACLICKENDLKENPKLHHVKFALGRKLEKNLWNFLRKNST
jgi:hypothetical protein